MFDFLNTILGFYANCGMADRGRCSDIVFDKYLLLSPKAPEFRRACCTPSTWSASCRWPRPREVDPGVLRRTSATRSPYSPLVAIGLAAYRCRSWPLLHGASTTCAVRTTWPRPAEYDDHGNRRRRTDLSRVPAGLRAAGHDRVRRRTTRLCSLCLSTDKVSDHVLPAAP